MTIRPIDPVAAALISSAVFFAGLLVAEVVRGTYANALHWLPGIWLTVSARNAIAKGSA